MRQDAKYFLIETEDDTVIHSQETWTNIFMILREGIKEHRLFTDMSIKGGNFSFNVQWTQIQNKIFKKNN